MNALVGESITVSWYEDWKLSEVSLIKTTYEYVKEDITSQITIDKCRLTLPPSK